MKRTDWLQQMRNKAEALYDHISPHYWVTFGLGENATHRMYLQKFLDRVPPHSNLLSAACGAGRYDGTLLEAGYSVVGIDQSAGMLARAREHFPEVRYEKIGLQEMAFHEVFDGAICMDVMEHVCPEEYLVILRGFQKALKPGGVLYFTADRAEATDFDLEAYYQRAKALGLPVVFGEVVDEEAYERAMEQPEVSGEQADMAVYHYYPPLEKVREWIDQAGFAVEEEGEGSGLRHFIVRKRQENVIAGYLHGVITKEDSPTQFTISMWLRRRILTRKEIHIRAGSISHYVPYIVLLFLWYFLDNTYTSMKPAIPESSIRSFLEWGYELVIVPFLLAGVFGGIHVQQRMQETSSVRGFFKGVRMYSWRIMAANLLALVLLLTIAIVISVSGGPQQPDLEHNKLLKYLNIPYSAITLFWFVATIVERRIFRGLLYAIKSLLFNPFALAIGIVWGGFRFADTAILDYLNEQTSFMVNGIRAGILAVVRILTIVYALALYKQTWGHVLDMSPEESASQNDELIKASFGFTLVSFLPFLHVIALILGFVAMKREKRFVTRSAIACCAGGFFTIFYLLLGTGWLIARANPANTSGYTFLVDANEDLKPYVGLLEQGSFQEVRKQIEQNNLNGSGGHWAFDSASALAKYHTHDLNGALEDFRIAAEKKPERSEFYYYYGIALLDNHQEELAAEQFRIAMMHKPSLEDAQRYLNLINTAYQPSTILSSLLFVIILLILFTLHEYGHAFAAWKLGDHTAKNLGRLTLNPIPHLEIFGSILLPAILLWQQSAVIFGWAKPVPVNPGNFKDPQKDHARVAFAGPAVNMIVSMVCLVILSCILLFVRLLWPETLSLNFAAPFSSVSLVGPPFARWLVVIVVFLKQLFYTSLVLGCFNLLPIPPLDGSWIVSGFLPQGLRDLFEKTRGFGFVIFLLLILTPALDYFLIIPIALGWGGLELLASAMGFG